DKGKERDFRMDSRKSCSGKGTDRVNQVLQRVMATVWRPFNLLAGDEVSDDRFWEGHAATFRCLPTCSESGVCYLRAAWGAAVSHQSRKRARKQELCKLLFPCPLCLRGSHPLPTSQAPPAPPPAVRWAPGTGCN